MTSYCTLHDDPFKFELGDCVECGHEHRASDIICLGDYDINAWTSDKVEMRAEHMCIWCVQSDYGNDPVGDFHLKNGPTSAPPTEGEKE